MAQQKPGRATASDPNPGDPSYASFPPFRETPNLDPSTDNPSPPPSSSSSAPLSPETPTSPTDKTLTRTGSNPNPTVSDAGYYDRFDACTNFRRCGGWVAVKGTACRLCVEGKAGGVLDDLREALLGDGQ